MAATSVDVGTSNGGLSEKQEIAVSWGTSGLLHAGVALLIVATMYAVGNRKTESPREIPIPVTGTELDLSETGNMQMQKNADISQEAFQRDVEKVPEPGHDVHGTLTGDITKIAGIQGIADISAITRGTGGGVKNGIAGGLGTDASIGRIARYRNGPPQGFLTPDGMGGSHGKPTRIAFVLDHSGSMIDTFDFLREEVKREVGSYGASTQFSVIMFSEPTDIEVLGPESLQAALPGAKRDLFNRLDNVRASGRNDDLLEPFTKALGRAFAMKPEVIVFLTDGKFDERLPEEVAKMNKDKAVRIKTIAFVKVENRSREQLEQIARDNGGKFKFVRAEDLGK